MSLSDETELLREPDPREPDPRKPYGRLFHEKGRMTVNAEREKPFGVGPWSERTDEQREIDMRGAEAVAVKAVHDAGIDLAAARKRIMQLEAELRQVLDRDKISDEEGAGNA